MKLAGRIFTTVILVLLTIQALPVSQILSEAEVFAQYVDTAWVRTYNGPGDSVDVACDIAVDDSGNVCVTGYSYSGSTYDDYATIKYYPDGDTAWLRRYNGVGDSADQASAIAVDDSGNVYVTGESYGATNFDYATIKYYPNGDTAWLRRYDGGSADQATSLTLDDSGNVYVTGASGGVESFWDYLTIKYYPSGETAWVRRYDRDLPFGGVDSADAIAVDDSGYVYVTGGSMGLGTDFDYATIKYYPNGDTAWLRRYDGPANSADVARAIGVDSSGNVYVAGWSVTSEMNVDYATVKYHPNGDTAWVRRYNGLADNDDRASAIAVDAYGNVYVTGLSMGSGTSSDYATIKYYPNGDTAWVRRYNGLGNDWDEAHAIAVAGSGNIYVAGYSRIGTDDDCATIKYDSSGNELWVTTRRAGPAFAVFEGPEVATDDSGNVYVAGYDYEGGGPDLDYIAIKYIQYDSIPFAPAVNYPISGSPWEVFCADVDGDSDEDLAVANHGHDSLCIFLNNSDGSFQPAVSYVASNGPTQPFCGDLDADNDLDIAVGNYYTDSVSVFKNNGNGTFETKVDYAAGDSPRFVFCADLDGDSDLDLAVANAYSDNVSILKNNGDGAFPAKDDYDVGEHPSSVFCADLDGDSDLDLAVSNHWSDNVSVLKNNGDGTFPTKDDYDVGNRPSSVFCADLDGDSDLDLAVTNHGSSDVSILKNRGDGTFDPAVNYPAGTPGTWVQDVFCADLDGDSDPDIIASNMQSHGVFILENNGDGTFQSAVCYGTEDEAHSVFCEDLDGDTDLDLVVTVIYANHVSVFKNLTQVPANQPPWAFSLISPTDGDTTFPGTAFLWHTPYDPNFGDQIRYDLHVSTEPGFDPDSTIVYDSLPLSGLTDTLEMNTYYWKVKAYDNWGAETWSTETWSFVVYPLSAPDTLWIIAYSPVDLIVTDPVGDSIGLEFNTIQDADYDTTLDWNEDGDSDDLITIPHPYVGEYQIEVIREDDVAPDDTTYDLGIRINGSDMDLLADDEPLPPPDGSSNYGYDCLPHLKGDVNGDDQTNSADIVFLINYLFKSGPAPDPLELGYVNCGDEVINSADVVYLINYLFKGGPPPCS